jgi:hypothetical protein
MLYGLTWLLVPEGVFKPLLELSSAVVMPTVFQLQYQTFSFFFFLEAGFSDCVDVSGVICCKSTWLD